MVPGRISDVRRRKPTALFPARSANPIDRPDGHSRYPGHPTDRSAVGTRGCGTADGEKGEVAVGGRTHYANGCAAAEHRDRAIARSRHPAPDRGCQGQATKANWFGTLIRCKLCARRRAHCWPAKRDSGPEPPSAPAAEPARTTASAASLRQSTPRAFACEQSPRPRGAL